jgi:hypothetical protein
MGVFMDCITNGEKKLYIALDKILKLLHVLWIVKSHHLWKFYPWFFINPKEIWMAIVFMMWTRSNKWWMGTSFKHLNCEFDTNNLFIFG